jgi:dephospho-CoA kinase
MLVVAVTGGIGSGKSTVAELFRKHGAPVIDTDEISRELVQPGCPALNKIIDSFGTEYLNENGSLNRQRLRDFVFSNASARTALQDILHPLIRQTVLERLNSIQAPYCLVLIPLLVETGSQYPHDRVLVVDVDPETQLQRTRSRDNLDEQTIKNILDAQVTREQRLALATDVLENNGTLKELSAKVDFLHNKFMQLATH